MTETTSYVAGPSYDLNMNLAALRRQVADLGSDFARLAALHEQLLEIVKPLVYASLPGYEEESAEAEPRNDHAIQTHPGGSSLIAERDLFAISLVGLEGSALAQWASRRCPLCFGPVEVGETDRPGVVAVQRYRHEGACPFLAAGRRTAEIREAG